MEGNSHLFRSNLCVVRLRSTVRMSKDVSVEKGTGEIGSRWKYSAVAAVVIRVMHGGHV